METHDVIIIGAGPAGLTAALYAARRALKTLVLGKVMGGQAIFPSCVDNYPGVPKTDGITLVHNWQQQALSAGAEIKSELATKIQSEGNEFLVTTDSGQVYTAQSIILALGRTPRKLDIPGEERFTGKGVAYCATCDAPLFAGKNVAIVGGGNAAVDAALLLSQFAHKVYLIHRHDKFKAEDVVLQKMANSPIELLTYTEIEEIIGKDTVEGIRIKYAKDNTFKDLPVQGVFIEIGGDANSELVKNLVRLNKLNEIVVDELNRTSVPGIFAAGDATAVPYKQMVIAAGEGAKAALSAYHYVQGTSDVLKLGGTI